MIDALRHIRAQSEALAAATEQAPDAAVPPCPGWTVADVATHVGKVHRLFADAVERGLTERPQRAEGPCLEELPAWVRAGADHLVAVLESADPRRPVWNWTGTPAPPSWVRRRMAHETAVHRWDAQSGLAGPCDPIPADLAPDGVDEFFDLMLPRRTEPWEGRDLVIAVARTDGPQSWTVRVAAGRPGVEVTRDGEDGPGAADGPGGAGGFGGSGASAADVAVRGSASDLLLTLWRRVPPATLEIDGDGEAFAAFVAWPRL